MATLTLTTITTDGDDNDSSHNQHHNRETDVAVLNYLPAYAHAYVCMCAHARTHADSETQRQRDRQTGMQQVARQTETDRHADRQTVSHQDQTWTTGVALGSSYSQHAVQASKQGRHTRKHKHVYTFMELGVPPVLRPSATQVVPGVGGGTRRSRAQLPAI